MRRPERLTAIMILVISALLVVAGLVLVLRPDPLPRQAILEISLRDDLPEESSRGVLSRFLGWQEMTVLQVVQALDAAAVDERVVAIHLQLGGLSCGLARAQDVRRAILRVRETGKPVIAMMVGQGLVDTYLASAADEVYLLPVGSMIVGGMMAEVPFARGVLDRVGVYPDFVIAGDDKDSPEVYTRTSMSAGMRSNMERMVQDLHDQIVGDMANGRHLELSAVTATVQAGALSAAAALEAGLIDGISHRDQSLQRVQELAGGEAEALSLRRYLKSREPGWLESRPVIALIHVGGVLVTGESVENDWYGHASGSVTVAESLKAVRDDEDAVALVLRIDSPGGSAEAAEILWREIRLTAAVKPVVVSMGDYAASGGYYLAVAADEILAEPATMTGSIGVFAGKFALEGLYDLIGLQWESVKSSANDDMFHDRLPWTMEQRQRMKIQVDGVHDRFKEVVALGRGLSEDEVHALASGRVFTGRQALTAGLVDSLGGLPQAVAAAGRRAGLEAGADVDVRVYPRSTGILAGLAGGGGAGALASGPLGGALADAALWDLLARQRLVAYSPSRLQLP